VHHGHTIKWTDSIGKMNNIITSMLILFLIGIYDVVAQPYTKDSLQFKIYTIATFKDSKLTAITLDRVFCDFCSELQKKALGQLGLRVSNRLINKPKNRLINGQKRLSIYLRVPKKEFANIKQKDSIND
jgi:predicted RNA-binding protein